MVDSQRRNAGMTGTVELQFNAEFDSVSGTLASTRIHPEPSKESSNWGLGSEPSWIDSELSKSTVGGHQAWDQKGTMLHTAQAKRVGELNAECMVALRQKRSEIQAIDARRKDFFSGLKLAPSAGLAKKLALPKLDLQTLDAQRRGAQTARVEWERSDDSWQDSLWSEGAFSDRSLRSVVTDREARRRWLHDTRELSREHALEPFAIYPKPPVPPKLLKGPQIDTEANEVRNEAKRISRMLHSVNVSLIKNPGNFLTSNEDPMPNRSQQLQHLREDLQTMSHSVRSIAYSLGARQQRPARFDYVKANMHTLESNRHQVAGARKIRQSVEFQDRIESVLVRNAEKQIEKCDDIARTLRRRERRQYKTQMADLASALERAQQTWLAAQAISEFTCVLSQSLSTFRETRTKMACCIQRFWRLYWQRMGRKKVAALAKITRWVRSHIGTFRSKRKAKASHKVKTYLTEMKDVVLVLPAIRRFKQRVLVLQRQVRAHLERSRAVRKKLTAHYDKQEKQVIFHLVREKVLKDRELDKSDSRGGMFARTTSSSGSARASTQRRRSLSVSEEPPMDWNKMFDEMYKFKVSQEIKDDVIQRVVRRKREVFSQKRKKWKEEMRDFRASFRTTTLFRAQIQDFLTSTGQERSLDNLEELAGANQSMQRMIRHMNKRLPIYPTFKDALSDDKMRHLVYQALFAAARVSYNIKHLMEGVEEPAVVFSPPSLPLTAAGDEIGVI